MRPPFSLKKIGRNIGVVSVSSWNWVIILGWSQYRVENWVVILGWLDYQVEI